MNNTIKALTTLSEETAKVGQNISPTKAAYILSKIMEATGYDYENYEVSEPVNPEEQQNSIKELSEVMSGIYSKTLTAKIIEAEVDNLADNPDQASLILDTETQIDTSEMSRSELIENNIKEQKSETTIENLNEDVQRYVIPLMLSRLIWQGQQAESEGKDRVYQSEQFTASLQIEDGTQFLTLDRNNAHPNQSSEALQAAKEASEAGFKIILNNLTEEEVERFKLVVLQEAQRLSAQQKNAEELGD